MKILIVAATFKEIKACQKRYAYFKNIDFLITGVGIPAVIIKLSNLLHQISFDLIINAGIAGVFSKTEPLGEVYCIAEDGFADIGFQTPDSFIALSDTNFKEDNYYIRNNYTDSFIKQIPHKKGITVNTASGNTHAISQRKQLFSADTESMEGAAVLYTCQYFNQACVQIRSISNYIEERQPENWDIPLAIDKLNQTLIDYIEFLNENYLLESDNKYLGK